MTTNERKLELAREKFRDARFKLQKLEESHRQQQQRIAKRKHRKFEAEVKVWYRFKNFDRKRWPAERRLILTIPMAASLYKQMHAGDDAARLVLADIAEENGNDWAAKFLRNNLIVCTRKKYNRLQASVA